jgi:hypothetical protein
MRVNAYLWCWINLHPGYVLRKLAILFGLAVLVMGPLLYLNVDLVKKGMTLSAPRHELKIAPGPAEP